MSIRRSPSSAAGAIAGQPMPPVGLERSPAERWPLEVRDLALAQCGVLRRDQLRLRGWTARQIEHEVEVGRWSAVAPRVVALQNAPLRRDQACWLGVLHAGEASALSHGSVSEWAGVAWDPPEQVHVMTPRGDNVGDLPGFVFHQSRRGFAGWVHPTRQPRQLRIEFAALLTAERDDQLRRALGGLAAHVQQRATTAERLLVAAGQIPKLRHGRLIRPALHDIAGGAQSFAEIDLVRLCRGSGLRAPDRQRVRRDQSGRRRYLDCEWRLEDGRVVVLEVDGSFHMRTDHWWADMTRERAVVLTGRSVLRCASIELRLAPEAVVADLRAIGVPPAAGPIRQ
jgi:very-short-patch-repair endonuclease